MVDKAKESPLPDKTGSLKRDEQPTEKRSTADPTYVRGTIDPPTKKGS